MELVDLAKEAFKRSNFDLANDLYDRLLDEHGQDVDFLMGKGDSLSNMGRVNEALSAYSHAFRMGTVDHNQLTTLVNALVKHLQRTGGISPLKGSNITLGTFSCAICRGLLSKPSTLPCGHSFCKSCLDHQSKRRCNICNFPYSACSGHYNKKLHVNVAISDLIHKYFPEEIEAQIIKAQGNELFKQGKHEEAVRKYTTAVNIAPSDHLCLSNRSHAYATQGHYVEALHDAVKVCQLRPDWAKGFYRKGTALMGLTRSEEAMVAFLQCLTLDPSIQSAKVALTKVLHNLLQPVDASSIKLTKLERSFPLQGFNFGVSDLSDVVKGNVDSTVVGGGSDAEDDKGSDRESPIQLDSKRLEQRKLSAGGRKYTKKRLPSQSADYLQSTITESSQPPSSENKKSNKRFKVCPLTGETCEDASDEVVQTPGYEIPVHLIEKNDFECSLCLRLFYQPTTTPCGHTFCRGCLERCLDYSQACPLCKQSLTEYLAERQKNVTVLLQDLMETYLTTDLSQRQQIHSKELEQLASHAFQDGGEVPIFVCTLALPMIPCPLHVFEPRYRLMVRQVMESGARQFGMCLSDDDHEFSDYGCMLEINQLEYLPDGRCILGTVGGRRFKVLERGMRDGYNTARVEFLRDTIAEGEPARELRDLNAAVYQQARTWFVNLPIYHQTRIVDHFGSMPQQANDPQSHFNGPQWHWWLLAILPLHPRVQASVMSKISLKERLQALQLSLTRMSSIPS